MYKYNSGSLRIVTSVHTHSFFKKLILLCPPDPTQPIMIVLSKKRKIIHKTPKQTCPSLTSEVIPAERQGGTG